MWLGSDGGQCHFLISKVRLPAHGLAWRLSLMVCVPSPAKRGFGKGAVMVLAERAWGLSIISILCFVGVGFYPAFTARQRDPQEDRARPGGWDREGAAKYLDERMEVWFTNAKRLRTGQAETLCVSCHTTIPYVIARPALRRAMQVSAATPQEMRLIEETTRR